MEFLINHFQDNFSWLMHEVSLAKLPSFECHRTLVQVMAWCRKADYTEPCMFLLRSRQIGRHFTDDTFKRIFLNKNPRISIKISLKFVPKGPINTIPALVQIIAWRRPGDKPLSEAMMVRLPTHICFNRPQWVKSKLLLITCHIKPWRPQCRAILIIGNLILSCGGD